MDHRLFAVLVIVCFALGGAGCASESQRASREEIVMPRQTGSTLHRRVMVKTQGATKKSKKKNTKRTTPKPTPKPAPASEAMEEATEEPTPAPPDRFR